MWYDGLTEKRRMFCEAFAANGGNAFDAAKQAGYSNPQQEGARLLDMAGIRCAIEELRKETTNKAIATREERQIFWTRIMRGESTDTIYVDGKFVDVPVKHSDRMKASELLGKCQGDFLERREITGPDGGPVKAVTRIERVIVDNAKD